jgi:2-C-methyl-D-erythritol 4-phosphate cytidylyltransferase/2-C-methyl-D-erythritol 2,4-cyclodiphosphate synthase
MKLRIGNGFDVHKLITGKNIVLCGIKIPYEKQLIGHSDADVAIHALIDAIFGALALGDIGTHFPPTEEKWRGVESQVFLKKAINVMKEKNFLIGNIDITIICEKPLIAKYALPMRENIANLCNTHIKQVSVKGTTSERLGFTGREEGIAAFATALLEQNG